MRLRRDRMELAYDAFVNDLSWLYPIEGSDKDREEGDRNDGSENKNSGKDNDAE